MAHVQTAFCHPSLGMKVHINVQDVIHLEGVTTPYKKHQTPSMGDLTESLIQNDENTHIILYVMEGFAGEAHAQSPCQSSIRTRYILSGGKLRTIHNILGLAWVSYQS